MGTPFSCDCRWFRLGVRFAAGISGLRSLVAETGLEPVRPKRAQDFKS